MRWQHSNAMKTDASLMSSVYLREVTVFSQQRGAHAVLPVCIQDTVINRDFKSTPTSSWPRRGKGGSCFSHRPHPLFEGAT